MAQSYLSNLSTRGVDRRFHEVMGKVPTIFQNHCRQIQADTDTMPYAFPGTLPQPREFLNSRNVQGIRDFTYNVQTKEYELTFEIPRKYLEDDQNGLINMRIDEAAEIWATYWDYQFAQLLVNGATAGNNGWDGATFYNDSRTIGSSATIDNKLTAAATGGGGTTPTAAEFQSALQTIKSSFWKMQDDQGRPFNQVAINDIRLVLPPDYELPAMTALNATIVSQTTNVFYNMAKFDVCPYLAPTAEATKMYCNLLGSVRKPFIDQIRTPLEVVVDMIPENVARNNAVAVMCRQRRVLAYGEPRRSIEFTWS